MATEEPALAPGASPGAGLVTLRWEEDHRYVPQAETEIPWFWQPIRAPSGGGVTETLLLPDALTGPMTVTLHVWSHTASPASPDHGLLLRWDGEPIEEWEWDGQAMQRLTTSLAGTEEEAHALALDTLPLPGVEAALVWLDGWEVTYRRRIVADGSVWRAEAGALRVSEARAGGRVVDVTEPFAPQDLGPVAAGDEVGVTPGHLYWVGVLEDAPSPAGTRAARELDVEALQGVDYLVIGPVPFHDALQELLEHRRSQGLTVAMVDPQAVYDVLGVGQPDPGALHSLVGRLPSLEYLLLVGDATVEPQGYSGEPGALRVVTPFTRTKGLGETPADGLLGTDREGRPSVAVGRFPAQSVEDVTAMVEKTIRWESEEAVENGRAVLLVQDDGAEFERAAERIAALLPSEPAVERFDVGEDASRAGLLAALDRGPAWLTYTGHGSLAMLSDEGYLTSDDGKRWRDPAVVLAWTCLAAYYAHPTEESIAEAWLRTPRGGSVAFLGPVGETTCREQEPLVRAFYSALRERERLGDAWVDALRAGQADDVRWGYTLLGDPALLVRLD